MILKEFEGKNLLNDSGLNTPKSVLVLNDFTELKEAKKLNFPVIVKAQVFHGNREILGLIQKVENLNDLESKVNDVFSKKDNFGQRISHVLIEEMVQFKSEYYVSISYSTLTRTPVIEFSNQGGVGMDDRGNTVTSLPVSLLEGVKEFPANPELLFIIQKLFKIFLNEDASLLEINPLVKTDSGYVLLDAKIQLEDSARFRHPEWEAFGKRSQIAQPLTAIEAQAKAISRTDTRGVAGESFFEFTGGNIGVMASGGGASTLAMDALLSEGLKPANYTEYSGNPTREKVYSLTQLVLSLPNLEALYVVGSNANFTDIYETLSGVVDGLVKAELPKGFNVLIRRGGPRWQEAFKMVKNRLSKKDINLKLFGPDFSIVRTAKELQKMITKNK
jgi:ATP-citrate lyase beta-subunit